MCSGLDAIGKYTSLYESAFCVSILEKKFMQWAN